MILKNLNRDNLHHAYLIESTSPEIVREITEFLSSFNIKTLGNPDFIRIQLDSFTMEDAHNLKSYTAQKSFSTDKRIFIISVNNFLLEAQNSLLKTFEEPIPDTHFFLIVPDINVLLPTFISRFYLISARQLACPIGRDLAEGYKDAEKFITLPLKNRIDFIKELLVEPEKEDAEGNEIVVLDSTRAKALKFINALEFVLHKKLISKTVFDTKIDFFNHLFKVRKFLRMPGSSTKNLMESVALIVPVVLQ